MEEVSLGHVNEVRYLSDNGKKIEQRKYTHSVRLPMPPLAGKFHGTRKGRKGYARQVSKKNTRDAILSFHENK